MSHWGVSINRTNSDYEVVVVAYRSRKQIEELFDGLPDRIPLILVDNSADLEDLSDLVLARSNVTHIDSGGNVGFAAAANIGARHGSARAVAFLNPDARPDPSVLDELVDVVLTEEVHAAAAPALVSADGALQVDSGGWEPGWLRALAHAIGLHRVWPGAGIWAIPRNGKVLEVDWLCGACLVVRRDAFTVVGGFDTGYFLYNSDMDLGRRLARAGFRQVLRGDLTVTHAGGESSDINRTALWERRGSGMAEYLHRTRTVPGAALIKAILTLGLLTRGVFYILRGPRHRVREMRTYAGSLWRLPAS